jgi:hypothetical protein
MWDLNQGCQKIGQEMEEQKSNKTMVIHNWTQRGKGTYTRTLLPEEQRSVEIKHRPIKMDSRTIHRTLSPKRTPFQTGIDR